MAEVRVDPLTGLRMVLTEREDEPPSEARPELYTRLRDRSVHELLDPHPLTGLGAAELAAAMEHWRERMRAHAEASCLVLVAAECCELFALDFVPALLARERERFGAYAVRTMGQNLLGDLVQEEVRRRERLVAYDEEAVLLCAFAARRPYQLLLVPRRPRARFQDDGPLGAALLHDGLARLARELGEGPPPHLWVRTAPQGAEHFCWRIDVVPQVEALTGLESATAVPRSAISPEQAAERLRAA
jgi:UDPglucose--hexose-1-phosphate uridylyltransferase